MRWRAYLRLTAILVNGLFAVWLLGVKAWWMPISILGGVPFIIPPVVALIALIVSHRERGL